MIQLEKYIAGLKEKDTAGYSFFRPTHINEQWQWEGQQINQ
jgi:hypothetical protein